MPLPIDNFVFRLIMAILMSIIPAVIMGIIFRLFHNPNRKYGKTERYYTPELSYASRDKHGKEIYVPLMRGTHSSTPAKTDLCPKCKKSVYADATSCGNCGQPLIKPVVSVRERTASEGSAGVPKTTAKAKAAASAGESALGLLFDYSKVGSGGDAWEIFWRVMKGKEFFAKLVLFEGDLRENDRIFCIGIQAFDQAVLDRVRKAFAESADFKKCAASPQFMEGGQVMNEPLPQAGVMDELGKFTPRSYISKSAYETVFKSAGKA